MEIIYRANDGTEFYDKCLCREYEQKKELEDNYLNKISPKTIFVTNDFRRVPVDKIDDLWNDIFGMYFPDNESAVAVQQYLGDDNWDVQWPKLCSGVPYWWDEEGGAWISLDEVRDDITEKINRICSAR